MVSASACELARERLQPDRPLRESSESSHFRCCNVDGQPTSCRHTSSKVLCVSRRQVALLAGKISQLCMAPMSQSMTIRISTPHSAATGISPELTRVTADSPVRAHPAPLPTSNSAIAKCRYAIPSRIRRRSHRHVIQGLRVHRARLETRLRKSSLSAATFSTGRVFFSPSH